MARIDRPRSASLARARPGPLRLLALLLALAGLAGGALWLARDLPRRWVEALLARKLDAEVHVGGFSVRGSRDFLLRDVAVTRMASQPSLERLRIGTVSVRGSVPDIIGGRFEHLHLSDLEARLRPPPARPAPAPTAGLEEIDVDWLEIERGRVGLVGPTTDDAWLEFEARIRHIGRNPEGTVGFQAARLPSSPFVALLGGTTRSPPAEADVSPFESVIVEQAVGSLGIERGGRRISFGAEAARILLDRPSSTRTLEDVRLDAVAVLPGAGRDVQLELSPSLPGLVSASVSAELDAATWRLLRVDARVRGLDLADWLPLVTDLPTGWEVHGLTDLDLRGSPDQGLSYTGVSHPTSLGVGIRDGHLVLHEARVEIGGELQGSDGGWTGTMRARLDLPRAEAELAGRSLPGEVLPRELVADLGLKLGEMVAVDGRVTLASRGVGRVEGSGGLSVQRGEPSLSLDWTWSGSSLRSLTSVAEAAGIALPGAWSLEGELSAAGTVRGTIAAPRVEGELRIDRLQIASRSRDLALHPCSYSTEMTFIHFGWPEAGRAVGLALAEVAGSLAVEPLDPVPVAVSAVGSVDPATGTAELSRAEVSSPGLGRATARATWSGARGATAEIRLEEANLEDWLIRLEPVLGKPLPGYSIRGRLTAELNARRNHTEPWLLSGSVVLGRAGLSSFDGARVVDGVEADTIFEGEADEDGGLEITASTRVGSFQALWDALYADYSSAEARIDITADAERQPGAPGRTWHVTSLLTLPESATMRMDLTRIPEGPVQYASTLTVENLDETLERYLRRPLQGSVEAIDRLRASGSVEARLAGTLGTAGGSARGRLALALREASVSQPELRLRGLQLDLPIDLRWERARQGQPIAVSGPPERGSLSFAELSAGGLRFPATATPLLVESDRVTLEQGLLLPFLGGTLHLEQVALDELIRPTRHLVSAVRLRGISLAEASQSLGLFPLEGQLEGTFPRVRLAGGAFRVDGDGVFSLFGGSLVISEISGQDFLSRFPKLTFSARFEGIDLQQLTRTFGFGEMTGILRGEIHDCELFQGVPVRLRGRLETVHRKGVPRAISVKAINNIALIGTGSRVGPLDRRLHRLVDRFTFERFAVAMILDRDHFLLRGLERRGEQELFIKGRLPYPIEMVNVKPGRTVSFRTMLDRLRNLDLASASTER